MEVHETIPWRLRTRKSVENRWDYNLPVSRVSPETLSEANTILEKNLAIVSANKSKIKTNEAEMKTFSQLIFASDDPEEIYALAKSRNVVAMETGNLQAQSHASNKKIQNSQKIIHEHRGEIGKFYLDGPHTTEAKALLGWPMVVAGGAAIYWYLQRNPLPRSPIRTLYRRSPISIAFRNA